MLILIRFVSVFSISSFPFSHTINSKIDAVQVYFLWEMWICQNIKKTILTLSQTASFDPQLAIFLVFMTYCTFLKVLYQFQWFPSQSGSYWVTNGPKVPKMPFCPLKRPFLTPSVNCSDPIWAFFHLYRWFLWIGPPFPHYWRGTCEKLAHLEPDPVYFIPIVARRGPFYYYTHIHKL